MSEPFIGEIRANGFNFAQRGWAFCDGQLLPISQNSALFSLLGTTYGGDGRTTFGLPDLQGRAALHMGQGPGLSNRPLGQKSGAETNTLNVNQLASHNHLFSPPSGSTSGNTDVATNNVFTLAEEDNYLNSTNAAMAEGTTGNTGANSAVNNMQPYQVVNFCIALVGIFPSRN
jgi:microcystin-dependent protein